MRVMTWDPFITIRELQKAVNDVFSDNLERTPSNAVLTPPIDIYKKGGSYFIEVSLPGVKKEEVEIAHVDGQLRIAGLIKSPDDNEHIEYLKKERASGRFERKFHLDDRIAPDQIKANFEDGILILEVPEPKEVKPEVRKIEIN